MKGKCRLTSEECELQNSHIYPKFVIEWMKSTGSKYLRSITQPNRRVQDGYKKYLLSYRAEQLFGIREKWFCENVFHNYLSNSSFVINYDDNLFYFAVSFLWRILVLELENPKIVPLKFHQTLKDAEAEWRNFLLNGIYPCNFDKVHLILSDTIISHTFSSNNVDYFFTRSLDGTVVSNADNCSIFAKFSKFIFWGFLSNQTEDGMSGTKIHPLKGSMRTPQQFDNIEILSFFPNRILQYDHMAYPSENQQEIIRKEILNNQKHYRDSELLSSVEFDEYMKERNKGAL